MKKIIAFVFLLSTTFTAFSQTKKNLVIRPGKMNGLSYDEAADLAYDGDESYAKFVDAYDGLVKPLGREINSRLADSIYVGGELDTPDLIVTISIRKSDDGSGYVFESDLDGVPQKPNSKPYKVEEIKSGEVAKHIAAELFPLPVPGTISLYRVNEYVKLVWSDAKSDIKYDDLEYMVIKSPVKENLLDKNSAIRLARQQSDEWEKSGSGGVFSKDLSLVDESTKQCFFAVVVRNSLGSYSVYPVQECQSISVSTYLDGRLSLVSTEPWFEDINHFVDIGLEETKNIMLSEGSWKMKMIYDSAESEEKSFEVKAGDKLPEKYFFDDVSEAYISLKYEQGMELKGKKKIDEAIKVLDFAAENQRFPHAESMYQLGCIYEEKKDMHRALEYYARAKESGSTNAKERLIAYYQEIVDGYNGKRISEDEKYISSLHELKKLLSDSNDEARIKDVSKKIDDYGKTVNEDKRIRARTLAGTKKDDSNYREKLVDAQQLYIELGDNDAASKLQNRINEYDKEQKKVLAKKLEQTDKKDSSYRENLVSAKELWNELGNDGKVSGIQKKIDAYDKDLENKRIAAERKARQIKKQAQLKDAFLSSQRHRTIFSAGVEFRNSPVYRDASGNMKPGICIPLDLTFGIWPNFFVGLSGDIDTFPNDSDYWTGGKNGWAGGSLMGTAGLNLTLWKHVNLYGLVGGGFWTLSNENSNWTDGRLRAGVGLDGWLIYDVYDEAWIFDKVGINFEYDVDYSFNKGVEDCFKIGLIFYWDFPKTSGFIPSFYNKDK